MTWSSKCLLLLSCWPGTVIAIISSPTHSQPLSPPICDETTLTGTARCGSTQRAQLSSTFTVKLVESCEMGDSLKLWPCCVVVFT